MRPDLASLRPDLAIAALSREASRPNLTVVP
jgi:hypothetical protein